MLTLATEAGAPLETVSQAAAGSAIALAWLIPVVPAVAAGLILLFQSRLGRYAAGVAVAAVGCSATLSTLVFLALRAAPAGERTIVVTVAPWLRAGALEVDWALLVDPLSAVMLLLVTWVGLLIHIYSLGYLHGDPRYPRFFGYLNLFVAAMLVLVLGESLLVTFVGWELVGLCSYLLVGFWYERPAYASAAKKAFVVNRIGDVGFMIAMFAIFAAFGSLSYAEVLPQAAGILTVGAATAIGLLLLLAATGKSAQLPLYVWLPDAMAGPTPVSALIHAATMVTAGVYLIARTSPIYAITPDVGLVVAVVGATTALITAIIACAQTDLKRILAYSTISQLGYMFIAVGVGDHVAGVFHLLTHGFFKALLFLAAGSVMHALAGTVDIRRMGGLARIMPITAVTSLVGVLAIAGLPPLSGFFSKEEVLAAAAGTPGLGLAIYLVGLLVAGLTAFYMTRWYVLVFLGEARWKAPATTGRARAARAKSGRDAPAVAGEPARAVLHPHESPLSMTFPLVALAVLAAVGGAINLNPETGFLHGWLSGVSTVPFEAAGGVVPEGLLLPLAVGVALVGLLAAVARYRRVDVATVGVGGGARQAAREAFRVDRAYEVLVAGTGRLLADAFAVFDRRGIDGAVDGLARGTGGLATVGRRVQTGFVRSYALAVLLGAVLVTVAFLSSSLRGGS